MTSKVAGPKARGRPKAADTMPGEEILAVALRTFATHGYDGVSLRTINRELGVSHNLIYQRFGTKEELWKAAVDYGFGGLVDYAGSAFDPTVGAMVDPAPTMICVRPPSWTKPAPSLRLMVQFSTMPMGPAEVTVTGLMAMPGVDAAGGTVPAAGAEFCEKKKNVLFAKLRGSVKFAAITEPLPARLPKAGEVVELGVHWL